MQGERWTTSGIGSWVSAGAVAFVVTALATACAESTKDSIQRTGNGGAGGASGTGVGGSGAGKAGTGNGGAQGGTGGGSTGGSAGKGSGKGGGGGQAAAGNGGAAGSASKSGGAAGRGAGGTAGTDAASGVGGEGEGGAESSGDCPVDAVGTWALGDDNLYLMIESDCSVSNFCSIDEGIHTQGSVTHTVMLLSSVGGNPVAFAYTVSGDTLTLLDAGPAPDRIDLPLSRTEEPLPSTCPPAGVLPRMGAVGVRCSVDGDCAVGLDCTAIFFRERAICTMPCNGSCPPEGVVAWIRAHSAPA